MNATLFKSDRILISDRVIQEVQRADIPQGTSLSLRADSGREIAISSEVGRMLLKALESIASNGEVIIGQVPEELTSTAAADMLGVSRPTLMKWAREGKIQSFKVRSHTRFKREEVLRVQEERRGERKKAFNELRSFDAENQAFFDD